MATEEGLIACLETAVATGSPGELASIATEIDRFVFDQGLFPGELLRRVLAVMCTVEFSRLTDSVDLLYHVFKYNLGLLEESQRGQLASALTEMVPRLADSVCAFLAVELLGELYGDVRSLNALIELADSNSETVLALAVHGFDWLAQVAVDPDVRASCMDQLVRFSRHPSDLVRAESVTALKRRTGPS